MKGKTICTFPRLQEGILLKRYKRFLADVELPSGLIVTAHCANTGPMTGVLNQGGKVRLRHAPAPSRKLDWSWEQAEIENVEGKSCWVGVNTSLPNQLVKTSIEMGLLINELGAIQKIQREVTYGINRRSRIDLFLTPNSNNLDTRTIYLEVKNTTWKEGSLGFFPDTVTLRGQKHLQELVGVLPESRAVLVPSISRCDVEAFSPGDKADPRYGELFRLALNSGVEIIPCSFGFHIDRITWEGKKPVFIDEKVI